ncbi:MAG: hypothetical protein NC311_05765 [Muribaculaceae bacterium]|nr:hypothetical protein [Ruminococcus flavefaciens]MCM1295030.1 hypothetical protein [Muribaculaceae bacterium]
MAVTAFTLQRALSEAASGAYAPAVDAYQFGSDDLGACTNEMAYIIACEAADYSEHAANADDVLTECALANPDNFTTLSEGVFSTMKTKIKAFFDKIISMVKGIIDKLKAFAYKMTGKVDKWVSVMEPKLREASGKTGASEFKAEMYKYDEKFILEGLKGGLASMMGEWDSNNPAGTVNLDQLAGKLKGVKDTKIQGVNDQGGNDTSSTEATSAAADFQKQAEDSKKAREDFQDGWASKLGGYFGASGSSVDEIYSDLIKKGHSGESQKTTETVGNRWSSMLSTIKSSKKTLTDIQKVYDDHLKSLQKFRAALEKSGSGLDIKDESKNNIPANVANAAREAYKEYYNHIMAYTQAYEGAAGRVRQVNTDLLNGMTSDYMTALSKFASFKGEKK